MLQRALKARPRKAAYAAACSMTHIAGQEPIATPRVGGAGCQSRSEGRIDYPQRPIQDGGRKRVTGGLLRLFAPWLAGKALLALAESRSVSVFSRPDGAGKWRVQCCRQRARSKIEPWLRSSAGALAAASRLRSVDHGGTPHSALLLLALIFANASLRPAAHWLPQFLFSSKPEPSCCAVPFRPSRRFYQRGPREDWPTVAPDAAENTAARAQRRWLPVALGSRDFLSSASRNVKRSYTVLVLHRGNTASSLARVHQTDNPRREREPRVCRRASEAAC